MEFHEKYWLLQSYETVPPKAREELKDYEFDGLIEFSISPTFTMDLENLVVFNSYRSYSPDPDAKMFIKKENDLCLIDEKKSKFMQVGSSVLSRNFDLQDFFDKNKDAKCIVFFLSDAGSIFHSGYVIRPVVITDELIENKLSEPEK